MGRPVQFADAWLANAPPDPSTPKPPTPEPPTPEPPTPEPPDYQFGMQRSLRRVPAPPPAEVHMGSLDGFRHSLAEAMRTYMMTPDPDYMLLIPAPPGAGKTWAGVDFAHWVYKETKRRVLYAGPRHDFFADVVQTAQAQGNDPSQWTEWLPRRKAGDDDGTVETCLHAPEINAWLQRGYKAMDFCTTICGWRYINNGCVYHDQSRKARPLIYGQHAHVVLGHTLANEFGVVVGDEMPLSSFVREWEVPVRHIGSNDLGETQPLVDILHTLQRLAENGAHLHGPDLIGVLGGAKAVIDACSLANISLMAAAPAPSISQPEDVHEIAYFYLPELVSLLQNEAEAVRRGIEEYPTRIWLRPTGLTLLLRRYVNERMPKHMIWFDATGTEGIYAAMFRRKVRMFNVTPPIKGRIYQVTDRANGKGTLKDAQGNQSRRVHDIKMQIDRICKREDAGKPAVITYKDLVDELGRTAGHFYGNRGTNQFESCDVLIVAGTPLPPLYQIEKIAKSLWIERMEPFDNRFQTVERRYNYTDAKGDGWAYPTPIFADHALNEILWQYREAEIIQAAHRARILFRDVPVYLLSNVPIDELPPTSLLTIRELMGAPDGVYVFKWQEVVEIVEQLDEEKGGVALADLQGALGIAKNTARKYRDLLLENHGWMITQQPKTGRGRPMSVVTQHGSEKE